MDIKGMRISRKGGTVGICFTVTDSSGATSHTPTMYLSSTNTRLLANELTRASVDISTVDSTVSTFNTKKIGQTAT
jgi:hypothetical protein